MFKKVYEKIKKIIKEDYKQLIILIFVYIVLTWPVNYYITTGGGISDVGSRIHVNNAYSSKGSFNITYVNELKGTVLTTVLSYIIPDWTRDSIDDYKINSKEKYDDILFRNNIDLLEANDHAIKNAYRLANKDYKVLNNKIYITGNIKGYKNNLKIKDQILEIDSKKYNDVSKYRKYIQTNKKDTINIKILRDKKEKIIKAKLHKYKNIKLLGVTLGEIKKYKTKPKIKIKFKQSESGSSGGLITTLDIYNKLTKKDITQALKIAGTGTVDGNGNVGKIGGVKYKLLGASKSKADIFLVPEGNYKECIKLKKKRHLKIKIIKVKTVKEAIKKLNNIS